MIITVFYDFYSTTGLEISKHDTQLAQPHTQTAEQLRSCAKCKTVVRTVYTFTLNTPCYHMKNTLSIRLNSEPVKFYLTVLN